MSVDTLIGTGWRFPINVDARGRLSWSSGPDRIRDAIWIVLALPGPTFDLLPRAAPVADPELEDVADERRFHLPRDDLSLERFDVGDRGGDQLDRFIDGREEARHVR